MSKLRCATNSPFVASMRRYTSLSSLVAVAAFALIVFGVGIGDAHPLDQVESQTVGPSQGPMKPMPDGILTNVHVSADNLSKWLSQELSGLGFSHHTEVLKEEGSRRTIHFIGAEHDRLAQVDLNLTGCEITGEKTACHTGKVTIHGHSCTLRSINIDRGWDRFLGPIPYGFQALPEAQDGCSLALEVPMIAEGPLMLIEGTEWLIGAASLRDSWFTQMIPPGLLSNRTETKQLVSLDGIGFRREQANTSAEMQWQKLGKWSDLTLDGLPRESELINTANIDQFHAFADRVGFVETADEKQVEIIISDTGPFAASWDTRCAKQWALQCDGLEFYTWAYFGDMELPEDFVSGPNVSVDHIQYGSSQNGAWITLDFNFAKRGVSPAFLKTVLSRFDGDVRDVQNRMEMDYLAVHENGLHITSRMIDQKSYSCGMGEDDQGQPLPEAAFYRALSGAWEFVSSQCNRYFNEGFTDAEVVEYFQDYLSRVDQAFAGEVWNELDWIVIASNPSSGAAGLYYWAEKHYLNQMAPGMVINIGYDPRELYSPLYIETLVHEFAHHTHSVDMRADPLLKYSGAHECVEAPSLETCRQYQSGFGDYLRAFWWQDSDGFAYHEDYNGNYRLIDAPDDFVSTYAASNAYEDFAESFTAAVLDEWYYARKSDEVGAAKIKFFRDTNAKFSDQVHAISQGLMDAFEISDPIGLYSDLYSVGLGRYLTAF